MNATPTGTMRRADRPDDYRQLGVDPAVVHAAEDGRRSLDGPGWFEWWYFDALLADGTALVVMLFTKKFTDPQAALAPIVSVSVKRRGDAAAREFRRAFAAEQFASTSSAEACAVTIGPNRFDGNLHAAHVEVDLGDVAVTLDLQGGLPPLRLGTGQLLFERAGTATRQFGWLAAVPRGSAAVTYRVDDQVATSIGTGYHDHNWGDACLSTLVHDWYWGRANLGGYTVIATHVVAQAGYGGGAHTDLVIAKDGRVVAQGNAAVAFEADGVQSDPVTGKPVADRLRYTLLDGGVRWLVTFRRQATLLHRFLDDAPAAPDADPEHGGAYHRFVGTCEIEIADATGTQQVPAAPTLWEMMWFGAVAEPRLSDLYMAAAGVAKTA